MIPHLILAASALFVVGGGAKPCAPVRTEETRAFWLELDAKEHTGASVDPSETPLSRRALERRAARRTLPGLVDEMDLPISQARIDAIAATGARVRTTSRWLNAVSAEATVQQLQALAALPFVRHALPLHTSTPRAIPCELPIDCDGGVAALSYGVMNDQLHEIDIPSMHMRSFHGEGMVIGVLDTGFNRVHEAFHSSEHPIDVIAEWDFVSNDGDTGIQTGDDPNQHKHGTWILGTLAAYMPGSAIGSAFAAQFVLCKTEVYATETIIEEDYYVAGLEFIEAHGADLATSSLGYIDWYTPEMLDGLTAITTRGVNIATANGLVCITAAGNAGNDLDPLTHTIIAPADAFDVITCGAANADGTIASFSSDGPTADGRLKPEALARGVSVASVNSTNPTGFSAVSGTSLSTPLIAGATALLMQARGDLTVNGVRNNLFTTASDFAATGSTDPLFVRGYGVISTIAAAKVGRREADINLDGHIDGLDLTAMFAVWGPCGEADPATGFCPGDIDHDGAIGGIDLAALLSAWGL